MHVSDFTSSTLSNVVGLSTKDRDSSEEEPNPLPANKKNHFNIIVSVITVTTTFGVITVACMVSHKCRRSTSKPMKKIHPRRLTSREPIVETEDTEQTYEVIREGSRVYTVPNHSNGPYLDPYTSLNNGPISQNTDHHDIEAFPNEESVYEELS